MLPKNFEEPAGFQWGSFKNAKGAEIRYGSLQPKGEPKGTIVVTPGFREPIDKYFEVIREMADRGFTVWAMDWRGQGGSERFLKDNPQKMFSEGYGEQIDTLHQFAGTIVKKSEGPFILLAHSMGAHIGLRYLKEHEGTFDSAVLTAPMVDIITGKLPKSAARQLVRFAKAGGYLEKYAPGCGDWDKAKEIFPINPRTSDPERYKVTAEINEQKPQLVTGDTTYGWVYHTLESIDILNKEEYLKAIKTPVLMEISGNEQTVDKTASERASKLLPNCTKVDIPEARHEIWMERDELRNRWITKVDAFLEERLNKHVPAPKKPEAKSAPNPPKLKPPKFG